MINNLVDTGSLNLSPDFTMKSADISTVALTYLCHLVAYSLVLLTSQVFEMFDGLYYFISFFESYAFITTFQLGNDLVLNDNLI